MTKAEDVLSQDPILKPLISKYEIKFPEVSNDLFKDLLEAIINQQLSNKASATIFKRFLSLFPKFPTPREILDIPYEDLRSAGLSHQKSTYIKSLSEAIISGSLDLFELPTLPNEMVIEKLVSVKGIGQWTAEMFLIFSLARPDVFSAGDLGLCTAVSRLYNIDRKDKKIILEISAHWQPYRSTACLYLWRSLENTDMS